MNFRILVSGLLLLALLGCRTIQPVAPTVGPNTAATAQHADPTVRGRVDFSGVRQTQATSGDVINSSTISFIDTGSNVTVAAGKTDASGSFSLNLGAFAPVNGGTYILEAIKGLNNQAPGSNAARFRTILQWNGTGWLSCTNSSVGGAIVINSLTTALAIESALDSAHVAPANTIGKVDASVNPAALNISAPFTNHPNAEISQLGTDLISYLSVNAEPVASVPSILPTISGFSPTSGAISSLVRIQGSGFSPVPMGNTVTFNGVTAQVLLATPASLIVMVPTGATTGAIAVQTGRGSVTGASFTVAAVQGSFSVSSFSPAAGRAGTVVTLTGLFGSGTATPSVSFACSGGTVQADVSAWSPTSMTVTVPTGVVPGTITVQQGMVTATSQAPFDGWPGDVSRMINITPASSLSITPYTMPNTIYAHGGATWGSPPKYHYVAGGNYGTPNQDFADVYMIPVNTDGSLGNWTHQPSLNYSRRHTAAAIYGNYLYVVGGYNVAALGTLATIERATINPADGSLSNFTIAATMQVPRYDMGVVITGTTLYILGGESAGARNDYESYSIAPNGDLAYVTSGTMTAGGVAFTNRAFGLKVLGNYLVMAGGYINETYTGHAVVVFPIGGGSTLGAGVYGPDLNQGFYETDCAALGNELYLMGGINVSGYHGTVAHSTFTPGSGTLSAWLYDSPNLTHGDMYTRDVLEVGNRIYTFGGVELTGGTTTYIQSTTQDPNSSTGALAKWSVWGALPNRVYGYNGLVLGNKAWVIGGYDPTLAVLLPDTWYYTIRDDGSIGPATRGPNLNKADRQYGNTIAAKGYLYVIGGYTNGGRTDTIERALINADGTLGSFALMTNVLPTPISDTGGCCLIGNYIYIFGGFNNSAVVNSILRIRLNADGSMGTCETYQEASLPDISENGGAAVVGNTVYVMRGYKGGPTADVWSAPTFSDGSIGTFSSVSSLVNANWCAMFGQIGNYLYRIGGWNGTPLSVVERAPLLPNGGLGAWANVQPGGFDIMPSGMSHYDCAPYVYNNWSVILGGYVGGATTGSDNIFVGSVH